MLKYDYVVPNLVGTLVINNESYTRYVPQTQNYSVKIAFNHYCQICQKFFSSRDELRKIFDPKRYLGINLILSICWRNNRSASDGQHQRRISASSIKLERSLSRAYPEFNVPTRANFCRTNIDVTELHPRRATSTPLCKTDGRSSLITTNPHRNERGNPTNGFSISRADSPVLQCNQREATRKSFPLLDSKYQSGLATCIMHRKRVVMRGSSLFFVSCSLLISPVLPSLSLFLSQGPVVRPCMTIPRSVVVCARDA